MLEDLIARVRETEPKPNQEWVAEIADWKARRAERLAAEERLSSLPLKPQRVYAELRKVMPRDAIICLDAGLAPNFGQDRLDVLEWRLEQSGVQRRSFKSSTSSLTG